MADLENQYRQRWFQYYNQRKQANTEGQGGSRTSLEKQHRHPNSLDIRRWAMARESAISGQGAYAGTGTTGEATATVGLSQSTKWYDAFMQFWVNPSECTWHVGLRSSFVKTSGGAIHHEIQQPERNPQANFTRFECPTLNISFQSGIIAPGGYNHIENGDLANIIPHGIANFYDFMDLVDQPNLTAEGQPNYINIMYVSPMHGNRGIWLRGFFDENGVSFTDTADNPNMINGWSASFLVCSSNPPLNKLRGSYKPHNIHQSQPWQPTFGPPQGGGAIGVSLPPPPSSRQQGGPRG